MELLANFSYYMFQNFDGERGCVQVYKITCVGREVGGRKGGRGEEGRAKERRKREGGRRNRREKREKQREGEGKEGIMAIFMW